MASLERPTLHRFGDNACDSSHNALQTHATHLYPASDDVIHEAINLHVAALVHKFFLPLGGGFLLHLDSRKQKRRWGRTEPASTSDLRGDARRSLLTFRSPFPPLARLSAKSFGGRFISSRRFCWYSLSMVMAAKPLPTEPVILETIPAAPPTGHNSTRQKTHQLQTNCNQHTDF